VELNLEATSSPSFPNISDVQQKDEIIYFQTQNTGILFGGILFSYKKEGNTVEINILSNA
jgi:hypothetical protein